MSDAHASSRPWWHVERHRDRRAGLLARNRIKSALRAWFETQGFVEVDTALLQVSPGNETHLHAFATELVAPDLSRRSRYLPTSPEFAMKKLIAAGEQRIFTFAPAFRNRERGPLHAPEFTMLEWYRAGEPYQQLFADCAAILAVAAAAADAAHLRHGERRADPAAPPLELTVAAALEAQGVADLLATLTPAAGDRDALVSRSPRAASYCDPTLSWADVFSFEMAALEPRLGDGRAVVLKEYPAIMSALARPCPHDARVAERFELFVCGIELANGFGELTDPRVQRANLVREMAAKAAIYGERYPIDEDFIAAVGAMPPTSGCALGFERLVMLATAATHIDQVTWTPPA